MIELNRHYADLKESYLFYNIAQKTKAYVAENPGTHLLRLGIGDVSQPLCPAVIDALNEVIDRYGIDYVYPAHDSALLMLTREQERLHAAVVTSDLETVEICRSKNKTYQFLDGASYLPRFFSGAEEVGEYPVFIKPSVGQGSEGAMLIHDRRELDEALSSGEEYAICEYLPGQEFTVD